MPYSEGCSAGGYRLAAADGDDYPLCCRHLAYGRRSHKPLCCEEPSDPPAMNDELRALVSTFD